MTDVDEREARRRSAMPSQKIGFVETVDIPRMKRVAVTGYGGMVGVRVYRAHNATVLELAGFDKRTSVMLSATEAFAVADLLQAEARKSAVT